MARTNRSAQKWGRAAAWAVWCCVVWWAPPQAWGQETKPQAALGRVAVLGNVSEVEQRIILTNAETILSRGYSLISREQYDEAERTVFENLSVEQCTEEQCIRLIQEALQVERLFILQILRTGNFTQISLNLTTIDAKRVEQRNCEDCSIADMTELIDEMASELIAEDLGSGETEGIAQRLERAITPPRDTGEQSPEELGPGCGPGKVIFRGQRGAGIQLMAVTSNQIYSFQPFAITSGTSGCDSDRVIQRERRPEVFVYVHLDNVLEDMARGQGEYVAALTELMGCDPATAPLLARRWRHGLEAGTLPGSDDPARVVAALRSTIAADPALRGGCTFAGPILQPHDHAPLVAAQPS